MARSRVVSQGGPALGPASAGPDAILVRRVALGHALTLRDAEGCAIRCCAGTVWITQENDARDIYLSAGESFTFDRPGLAVIIAAEGMKDDWLSDTGITAVSGPEKLLSGLEYSKRHPGRSEKAAEIVAQRHGAAHAGSAAGLAAGARLALTAVPVMALFGTAFGTVAAQKDITLLHAVLMSAFLFAGASQFVAADIWTYPMTAATVATLALVTATVNMRFVLITASLQPWLAGLPAWRTYPALSLMTEPGWLVALRYRAAGGSDASILLGSGIALWLTWIASTAAGYLLGSLVAEPQRYGLDLVMPVFFAVMLVPLWAGPRRGLAWMVAGAAAVLTAAFVPGWWHIVAGALAGSAAAGAFHERD